MEGREAEKEEGERAVEFKDRRIVGTLTISKKEKQSFPWRVPLLVSETDALPGAPRASVLLKEQKEIHNNADAM